MARLDGQTRVLRPDVGFLEMRTAVEGWADGYGPNQKPYWMCCREELMGNFAGTHPFENSPRSMSKISTDSRRTTRYVRLMPTVKTRPVIRFLTDRNTAKRKAIAKAVEDLATLRKTDPKAYRALIEKYADQPVRIVAG